MAYTGTHDNDTEQGWWRDAPPRERAFAGSYLAAGGDDIHWAWRFDWPTVGPIQRLCSVSSPLQAGAGGSGCWACGGVALRSVPA